MTDYNRPTIDLYRHWDDKGALLYVGISLNAAARASQHSKDKPWWSEVATITVEHLGCISRSEAESIEAAAIKAEAPRYNVVHNGIGSMLRNGRNIGKDRSIDCTWLMSADKQEAFSELLWSISGMTEICERVWGEGFTKSAFVEELLKLAELSNYRDGCEKCLDEGRVRDYEWMPFRAIDYGNGAEFRYRCTRHNVVWSCWYAYKETL